MGQWEEAQCPDGGLAEAFRGRGLLQELRGGRARGFRVPWTLWSLFPEVRRGQCLGLRAARARVPATALLGLWRPLRSGLSRRTSR